MATAAAAHEPVDLAYWIERFPLEQHWRHIEAQEGPDFWYNAPNDIFSPRDLALTEQLRARADLRRAVGAGTPVDVLLPAWGEPTLPFASKVGGVPYVRRGEWPIGADGRPYIFLAQLCFADSRDVLPRFRREDIPADVLVIFYEDNDEMIETPSSGASLRFEWKNIGIPHQELMRAEDMPRESTWTPTHFQRYRSFESDQNGYLDHPRRRIEVPGSYVATKIGGTAAYLQDADEAKDLGTYFASLHSINPGDREYPFPNLPEAGWRYPWEAGLLMFGDVGTLYLYASGHGEVSWLMQCS